MGNLGSKFRVGDRLVDTDANKVDDVHIGATAMNVLVCLAEAAPGIVSREALLAAVWPKVVVGDNALDQAVRKIRRALGDGADAPRYLQTVPRRGYRLRVPAQPATAPRIEPTVAFVALRATGDDPALRTCAGLVTADLVKEFARTSAIAVMHVPPETAHPATFQLEGAVESVPGNRVRVTLQLLRAENRQLLWCDDTTHEMEQFQFGRAAFVVSTVEVRLHHLRRSVPAKPLRDYEAGMVEWTKILLADGGDWNVMMTRFERAVVESPHLPWPRQMMAIMYANRLGGTLRAPQAIPVAHHYARLALSVDPNATYALGQINGSLDLDYPSAIANLEHARRTDGVYNGIAEARLGDAYFAQGRFPEAISHYRSAIEYDALQDQMVAHVMLARSLDSVGLFDDARREIDRANALHARPPLYPLLIKFDICHRAGDIAESRRTLDQVRSLYERTHPHPFAKALATIGEIELARQILRDNEAKWQSGTLNSAASSFSAWVALEDLDHAFVWLERAVENREWRLIGLLRGAPTLAWLRDDPRWRAAIARLDTIEAMGSPTTSIATQSRAAEFDRPGLRL